MNFSLRTDQSGDRQIPFGLAAWVLVAITISTTSTLVWAQDEVEIRAKGEEQQPTTTEPEKEAEDPSQVLRQELARLASRGEDPDLDESSRQAIRESLEQSEAALTDYDQLREQNTKLKQQSDQLAQQAEQFGDPPTLDEEHRGPVDSLSIEDLERALATVSVRITSEEQTLATHQETAEQADERKRSLQERVAKAEQEATAATEQFRSLPAESATLADAVRRAEAAAERFRAVAEFDLAKTTLVELDARLALKLPSMRVAYHEALLNLYRERSKELNERLESLRQDQSRQELARARDSEDQLAAINNPAIRSLGELRIELATESDEITQQKKPYWNQILQSRQSALAELKKTDKKIRDRVKQFGTDSTLGRQLLRFGAELPDIAKLRDEIDDIDELTAQLSLRELEIADELQRVDEIAEKAGDGANAAEVETLNGVKEVLQQLQGNNRQLFDLLGDVNAEDIATIKFIESWNEFSGERALWLRSHPPLTTEDLDGAWPTLRQNVADLGRDLRSLASRRFSLWAFVIPAAIAIVVLLAVQSRAKDGLMRHGEVASARSCLTLGPTLWAVLLSVGLAAEWPLFMVVVGSMLQVQSNGIAASLGESLVELGGIALWLNFFRQVFRPGGLAACHLGWNQGVCNHLRRWLRLVFIVIAVPMFLFLLARNIPDQTDTLDRILFVLLLACSTVLLMRLLFPVNGGFVQALTTRFPVLHSTRYLWSIGIVATPVFLSVCAATGFYHTALVFWDRLGWSVVAGTGIILGWSLVLRWLRTNHRATRLELARERAIQREQADASSDNSMPQPTVTEDAELLELGTQAQQLVRNAAILVMIGCAWGIWSDVLPALRVLERYELWSVRETVTVPSTDEGAPADALKTRIVSRPVTVGSLLLVLFVATATTVGVRQLPGLIEVILLRQSSFDGGIRYTITTVFRYAILIAGTAISCYALGLRWTQVQWLVAGLSVGLGFGLQEVFANFVSGIIILVERPIRIGDVVTIDGVSGVVSKIQIRATSITDWDRREYIVPNRELVTGKLLNWTLSDSTNRIMIAVGIGYSCDPDAARATMLRVAQEHPNVMDDPEPLATFEEFGDSSLNLVLRAYLPDMDNRLGTITELHTQIHRSFAEEGIDIPYPQRDLHISHQPAAEELSQDQV